MGTFDDLAAVDYRLPAIVDFRLPPSSETNNCGKELEVYQLPSSVTSVTSAKKTLTQSSRHTGRRQKDWQTDRQRQTQTYCRQAGGQTVKQAGWQTGRQAGMIGRQA
jgi:hypothetical protein